MILKVYRFQKRAFLLTIHGLTESASTQLLLWHNKNKQYGV